MTHPPIDRMTQATLTTFVGIARLTAAGIPATLTKLADSLRLRFWHSVTTDELAAEVVTLNSLGLVEASSSQNADQTVKLFSVPTEAGWKLHMLLNLYSGHALMTNLEQAAELLVGVHDALHHQPATPVTLVQAYAHSHLQDIDQESDAWLILYFTLRALRTIGLLKLHADQNGFTFEEAGQTLLKRAGLGGVSREELVSNVRALIYKLLNDSHLHMPVLAASLPDIQQVLEDVQEEVTEW